MTSPMRTEAQQTPRAELVTIETKDVPVVDLTAGPPNPCVDLSLL